MSAQQNYITHKNDIERYYQQGLMSSNEINDFNEAKRIGEQPYSIASGFPFKATELMKNLLDDIRKREAKEAVYKSKHNDGSSFRAGIAR